MRSKLRSRRSSRRSRARENELAEPHTDSEGEIDEMAWNEAIDADEALEALMSRKIQHEIGMRRRWRRPAPGPALRSR